MAKASKRMKAIRDKLLPGKAYSVDEAMALVRECALAKFDESVDVSLELGIDPRKVDQAVRGSTVLPHGTGKSIRVAVFAQGEAVEAAKAAGADVVGLEDLAESIKSGDVNFDVVIATPETMRVVSQLGPILGPRGLMPNPKVGTVTTDAATAVKNAKGGQVRYRTGKGKLIQCTIGKASFEAAAIRENLQALVADVRKAKPSTSKGEYLRQVTVSSTMGPGIRIDRTSLGV